MSRRDDDTSTPSLFRWAQELPNLALIAVSPLRKVKPTSEANAGTRPVLVFPGIMSSDSSTSLFRRSLEASGYHAYPSGLGFVTGITPESFATAQERLAEVAEENQQKVILIGWSLGGFFSRVLAQRFPDLVEMVVTLATPFSGDRHANNAWRLYDLVNDHTVDDPVFLWKDWEEKIQNAVRFYETAEERDEAVEVPYRHFALATNRKSIAKIIEILDEKLGQQAA